MIVRASTRLAGGPRPCRDGVRATQVIDEPKLRAARSGRLGFTFVVIAMRCWQAACQMFLPNRTTQRELDIQKRRDPAAEKEDIISQAAGGVTTVEDLKDKDGEPVTDIDAKDKEGKSYKETVEANAKMD